jgi:DcmR-like sensory protein
MIQALSAGDHCAARFDTMAEFTANTLAQIRRALAHDAQVVVFPPPRQLHTTQRIIADAGTTVWRAVRDGQVRLADTHSFQLNAGRFDPAYALRRYAEATAAAVDEGYSGLWAIVDMTWTAPPAVSNDEVVAYEASVYPLLEDGRFTALCQYAAYTYSPAEITAVCRAHPVQPNGVRVRHSYADGVLRLSGDTDLTNGTAFAVLVASAADGGTVDVTGMGFVDVAGYERLAGITGRTRIVCTESQAQCLRIAGADPSNLAVSEP